MCSVALIECSLCCVTRVKCRGIVVHAASVGIVPLAVADFQALPGKGVECLVHRNRVAAGSLQWLRTLASETQARSKAWARVAELESLEHAGKTVVGLARDGALLGAIAMADTLKPGLLFLWRCRQQKNEEEKCTLSDSLVLFSIGYRGSRCCSGVAAAGAKCVDHVRR